VAKISLRNKPRYTARFRCDSIVIDCSFQNNYLENLRGPLPEELRS
jgi:hypothetical protein